jgi:hypothetical protein
MWWFPNQIQIFIELLLKKKPMEGDMPGLLSLIMFAGLESKEEEYFENQIMQHQYLSQTAFTPKGKKSDL